MSDVIVVTGGDGGIGSAVVERFRAAGDEVVVGDRSTGVDITSEVQVAALFEGACARGRLRAVVLAAGVLSVGAVLELELEEWQRTMAVNLTGSFLCAREAVRCMPDGGSIVFISSQAGRRGAAGWAAYSASKFGVIGLMESLAQEVAPRGIRCNAICPGSVDTPMLWSTGRERDRLAASIPLGRIARPHEIASVVSFLCSEEASYMSGASIVVDGAELS